jgi:hypothetical protein
MDSSNQNDMPWLAGQIAIREYLRQVNEKAKVVFVYSIVRY